MFRVATCKVTPGQAACTFFVDASNASEVCHSIMSFCLVSCMSIGLVMALLLSFSLSRSGAVARFLLPCVLSAWHSASTWIVVFAAA